MALKIKLLGIIDRAALLQLDFASPVSGLLKEVISVIF
jgi:hypothetical protein